MGETRVDLLHLLEDLRDAYPGAIEETILTEVVANALDSGARLIALRTEPAAAEFTALDNGSGMQRRELARYHDIATSSKVRGRGIGFAGVGIKLGLLICEHVITETRRGATHVATQWQLASRHKAPWRWVPPPGLVPERGTAVRLKLANPLSPLLDGGFVEGVLRRHFAPFFDATFAPILIEHHGHAVTFEVDGRALLPEPAPAGEVARLEVRLARKRKPSAIGLIFRDAAPLPESQRGLAVSTLGKIIKRGWDWLGITPANPDRIGGVIEVPALAECLTLNKADFIRTGTRGATYLAYRKAIQEVVSRQLAEWGDAREREQDARRRAARPVERDLERVLVDLADDYPLLTALVDRYRGGQRRLATGGAGDNGRSLVAAAIVSGTEADAAIAREAAAAVATSEAPSPPAPEVSADEPQPTNLPSLPGSGGPRRPAHYGLHIQFDQREDDTEIARLVESTVWINELHPAFRRAAASRSEGYHIALGVALALAPLAVEPAEERNFVTSFLRRWGEAVAEAPGSGRGRRR